MNYLKGLRHGLPIALGYLSVSFAFGIQATLRNLDVRRAHSYSLDDVREDT